MSDGVEWMAVCESDDCGWRQGPFGGHFEAVEASVSHRDDTDFEHDAWVRRATEVDTA
jgi:hypothetical protein